MANFGNFCLLFALCLSAYSFFAVLIGASQRRDGIVRSAERAAFAAAGSAGLALLSLLYLLLTDDFSTSLVANSSNRELPLAYKISALWGGHDGSMLLWVFFTAVLSAVFIFQNRFRYRDRMPYVVAVLMFDLSFFLILNLFFSNPFNQLVQVLPDGGMLPFVPENGQGLNPLLHHWAMVIHPPIIYLGFIGFLIPFAFAAAALITKQSVDTWTRATRRWILLTWIFLGVGIILGSKWAYVVLGWGGYWGWDPVENSSLMPWLLATALLHSVIVQERTGMMKVWNMLLMLLTYLFTIFGTFVTRSGVVSSVHAFADSNLGKFLLSFMIFILCAGVLLIIGRRSCLKSERRFESMLSRESGLLFNNIVLVVSCFAVFWGTMFPVFSEWIQGSQITVGPPFYNKISIPIGLLLLFLTGVGSLLAWRRTPAAALRKSLLRPLVFMAAACVGLLAGGMRNFYTIVCFGLSAFVIAAIVEEFYRGARARIRSKGESVPAALVNLTLKNKRRYGGYVVHLSIVMIFVGFSGSAFNQDTTRQLSTGQEMQIGGYSLKMAGYREGQTPNYQYGRVVLEAFKNGRQISRLAPEKRLFKMGDQQLTTTVALHSTPREDLYVIFDGISENSKYEITAHINPLVFWIWFGSIIMAFGTVIVLLETDSGGK